MKMPEFEPLQYELVGSLPFRGRLGVVYITAGDLKNYVYVNQEWHEISGFNDEKPKCHNNRTEEKLPTNCKNCGAVLKGHICEYCGTRY